MLCLSAGLCACKKEKEEEDIYVPDETLYAFSMDAAEDLSDLTKAMGGPLAEAGQPEHRYAVAYLGWADVSSCAVSVDQLAYSRRIADGGYEDRFLFLAEIPSDRIIETENGNQMFCLVPDGYASTVKISLLSEAAQDPEMPGKDNGTAADAETVLYCRNCNDPVVFCVNPDGKAEVQVEITESTGEQFTFVPVLRAEDGCPDCGEEAYDFTIYPEKADEAYLDGSWVCRDWIDDGENTRTVKLRLTLEDHTARYGIYTEDGRLLIDYKGSWSLAPEDMAFYKEGSLVLDLVSESGAYIAAGAPSAPFSGAYIVRMCDDGALSVRNVYGDPLAYGSEFTDMIFVKESDR